MVSIRVRVSAAQITLLRFLAYEGAPLKAVLPATMRRHAGSTKFAVIDVSMYVIVTGVQHPFRLQQSLQSSSGRGRTGARSGHPVPVETPVPGHAERGRLPKSRPRSGRGSVGAAGSVRLGRVPRG